MTAQTILPANSVVDTGFNVANSLRFNDGSSDYLSRSNGTPTSLRKYTFSAWVKKTATGALHTLYSNGTNADNYMYIHFNNSTEQLEYVDVKSGAYQVNLKTTRVFRDPSAWYHIMIAVDTTQGTNTNRVKFYINGVQETSFVETTYPDQNDDLILNGSNTNIGRYVIESSRYYDGYMSEVVFVDGTQQANTDLGEFDSDSGIWKPIDVSGLTFGDNGYYLEFKQVGTSQNSSGMGADTSGEDNHFAVSNLTAIDQTTDTCTNNFMTLNPLITLTSTTDNQVYSEGNTVVIPNSTDNYGTAFGTFGATRGKWYWEAKIIWNGTENNANYPRTIGFMRDDYAFNQSTLGQNADNSWGVGFADLDTDGWGLDHNGNFTAITGATTLASTKMLMFALDLDNGKFYMGYDGTFFTSGDPTSGSTGTGAIATLDATDLSFNIIPALTNATNVTYYQMNFGNPAYAIASSNADGDGFGNFEFAVPSGYFSWCTKNLAEYG